MRYRQFKALRCYLGISQNEMAREVGLTQPTIARIERGSLKLNKKSEEKAKLFFEKKKHEIISELEKEINFFRKITDI